MILHRENVYSCIVRDRLIKSDWLVVDQDQIDLRMWNTTRLDDVFNRGLFRQLPLDHSAAGFWHKKEIEVAVELKPDREWIHIILQLAQWRRRIRKWLRAVAPSVCRGRAAHPRRNNSRSASAAVRRQYP